MKDLADFLLARIEEDAAALSPGHPYPQSLWHSAIRKERAERLEALTLGMLCPTCHAEMGETCRSMTPPHHAPKPANSLHSTRRALGRADLRRRYGDVAAWNRARVLAECDAKRQLVRQFVWAKDRADDAGPLAQAWWEGQSSWFEGPLRSLASVYADHPDYRPEWR